jgi:hypothetical protein
MAKIIEEKYILVLSKLIKEDQKASEAIFGLEELDTLQQAVEGLVDNPSIIVEIENIEK